MNFDTGTRNLTDLLIFGCNTIVTTQLKNWGACYEVVTLDVLPDDVAMNYLNNNLPGHDGMEELSKELGNHPLGIEHAVAFIKQSLTNHRNDILLEEVVLDNGVNKSVFTSFLHTIKKIENEYKHIGTLLPLLGVLDGAFISEKYLKRSFQHEFPCIKAKKELLKYSMIKEHQFVSLLEGQPVRYLTIHSLYQHSFLFSTPTYPTQRVQNTLKYTYLFSLSIWSLAGVNSVQYILHILLPSYLGVSLVATL